MSGGPVLHQALDAFRGDALAPDERVRWTWLAGRAAAFIWGYDTWDAWLRRERRHVDARDQLGQAHDLLTDFGMEGYAERAPSRTSCARPWPRHLPTAFIDQSHAP